MKILAAGSEAFERWWRSTGKKRERGRREASAAAATILADVRRHGDAAVARFLRRFDGVRVRPSEIAVTVGDVTLTDKRLVDAIELAIDRITAFHAPQRDRGYVLSTELRHVVRPIPRVGIYVPGGSAVYLSTLIMCAVPARLAGVVDLVVATSPRVAACPEFLHACRRLGISEIYRASGPAAIAALAFGTRTLVRVDKIVGPGNRYVTEAKRLLFGEVGIDLTAGPSEIVILADETTSPELAAADLAAQAEHGSDVIPICVTTSMPFAIELKRVLQTFQRENRHSPATASLRSNGAIITTTDLTAAIAVVEGIAPEHLEVLTREPEQIAPRVDRCAAVFLGSPSAVALGDYVAGTNHVLPTGGSARFFSPLGVYDFYRRSNVVALSAETSSSIAPAAESLAIFELLPLHAQSVKLRMGGIA